jgi:tetratricopeptide (TPR) repeat protein
MLNRALRIFEMDTILKMGFFLADIHRQIVELHEKQLSTYPSSLTVYRGQSLSKEEFNKLIQMKGEFISFNNFLSTSKDYSISLQFARNGLQKLNFVGLLFVITIDPENCSTPFALLDNVSYYKDVEQEILFSMHTVFRIGDIQQFEHSNQCFWKVNLILTNDHDEKLVALTKSIRHATNGATGWYRLGQLLLTVNALNKAEDLYMALIERTALDSHERGHIYHMLGMIKNNQGDYPTAVSFFEKSLKIQEQKNPRDDLNFASTCNNIGSVYDQLHEYSKALLYQEKALAIRQKLLPTNHPDLATSFDNIGRIYSKMGDYTKALSFYEKDLDISQQSLPSYHPDLATSYNNIAVVYNRMGDYTKALSFYEKALEISQQSLPPNHPDLASTYNNIASAYYQMEEYDKARSFYEHALQISKQSLSTDHPNLAISYENIGFVYYQLGDCSKCLSFYEKALEIKQKILPSNHSDLAISNNLIGNVYDKMCNYSKAILFYERALQITKCSIPSDPRLVQLYENNLELAKNKL